MCTVTSNISIVEAFRCFPPWSSHSCGEPRKFPSSSSLFDALFFYCDKRSVLNIQRNTRAWIQEGNNIDRISSSSHALEWEKSVKHAQTTTSRITIVIAEIKLYTIFNRFIYEKSVIKQSNSTYKYNYCKLENQI